MKSPAFGAWASSEALWVQIHVKHVGRGQSHWITSMGFWPAMRAGGWWMTRLLSWGLSIRWVMYWTGEGLLLQEAILVRLQQEVWHCIWPPESCIGISWIARTSRGCAFVHSIITAMYVEGGVWDLVSAGHEFSTALWLLRWALFNVDWCSRNPVASPVEFVLAHRWASNSSPPSIFRIYSDLQVHIEVLFYSIRSGRFVYCEGCHRVLECI